jgi:acetyl-CoA acyltransferase
MYQTLMSDAKRPANRMPVFVDGIRSPFVKSFGVFEDCDSLELFARTTDALIRKTGVDVNMIDEIIAGCVIPQTKNPNIAKDAAMALGLPDHIHGYTLNRACTSSLQTIADASKSIAFGSSQLILAGGVECLSDVPIVYSKLARKFLLKLSKAKSLASKIQLISNFPAKAFLPVPPGLTEPLTGFSMGEHAEMMAKIWKISRESQDAFAEDSHKKAAAAVQNGKFADEIAPIWPAPKHVDCIDADNIVRGDTSIEALSKLRPAFDRQYGTITAGNASALTDGAAVSLIGDEAFVKSIGLKAKARIRDVVFVGVQPTPQLLIGPAVAIPLLLHRNGLSIDNVDRFEIHEAFAAQVLSCFAAMQSAEFCKSKLGLSKPFGRIPTEKLNVNGGALAIGHPFGATGSRLVTTMVNELQRSKKNLGVIAICAAGGMSGAMLVEAI